MKGRVWVFGDDINTDLIQPGEATFVPLEQQPSWCMTSNRPGWNELVETGDILVAGRNFGTGSSRPAARVLKQLGIGCLVADSINGLFFRNCVNYAFPAIEVPGVSGMFVEGQHADIDFTLATVTNVDTSESRSGAVWPTPLRDILDAGGLIPLLEAEGLVEPHEPVLPISPKRQAE